MLQTRVIAVGIAWLLAAPVGAKIPARNMSVEWRALPQAQAQDLARHGPGAAGASAYVLRSQPPQEGAPEVQKVLVANGERVRMQLDTATPVQWVKAAVVAGATHQRARGVEQVLYWMPSVRSLAVQVRWPGGSQPATLQIEVEQADAETQAGNHLPSPSRSQLSSTVRVPLGEWTTIAVTGARTSPQQDGVYSTRALQADAAQALQVRVLAP